MNDDVYSSFIIFHSSLALPLFELRVFLVDDIQLAFAAYDFAINRALLDGRTDFHCQVVFSVCENSIKLLVFRAICNDK